MQIIQWLSFDLNYMLKPKQKMSHTGKSLSRNIDRKNISMKAKRRNVNLEKKQTLQASRICLLVCLVFFLLLAQKNFVLWFFSFSCKRWSHADFTTFSTKNASSQKLHYPLQNQFWPPFVWYWGIQRKVWAPGTYLHSRWSSKKIQENEWEESLLW